jgi:hypothetical protein
MTNEFDAWKYKSMEGGRRNFDNWVARGWCDCRVIIVMLKCMYELYHHYSDLLYTFSFPHADTVIAVILLLFIWAPFYYNIRMLGLNSWSLLSQGWCPLFSHLFVMTGTVSIRKFYRGISNNLVHLFIQITESVALGYTFTNYLAIIPAIAFITNMSILAQYQTYNKVRLKLKVQEMLVLLKLSDCFIYLLLFI